MSDYKQGPATLYKRFLNCELLKPYEYEVMRQYLKEKEESNRFIPVIACKDDSGHWYVIPKEMEVEFHNLLNGGVKKENEFIEKFSEYMTGGDLNLTQLYMKVGAVEESHWQKFPEKLSGPDIDEHGIAGHEFKGMIPDENYIKNSPVHEYDDNALNNNRPITDETKCGGPRFPRFLDHEPNSGSMIDKLANIAEKFAIENKTPSALEMVEEFHMAFEIPVLKTPGIPDMMIASHLFFITRLKEILEGIKKLPDVSRSALRMKIIFEEFIELYEATMQGDIVKALDGLSDLLYTTYGTHLEFGTAPVAKEAFREVHRSNMSKLGADGKPVMREDGKVLKGPNFSPPDLTSILVKPYADKLQENLLPLLKQPNDAYERQVTEEQPPADDQY